MKTINELVNENYLHKLATPSNFQLGEEIFRNGEVQIVEETPLQVTAKARAPAGKSGPSY
jgi:hypothetical protein